MTDTVSENSNDSKESAPKVDDALVREHLFSDASPFAIVVHSDGTVIMANLEAARLMCVAGPEALVGTPVLDYVHPDWEEAARKRVAELYSSKLQQSVIEMRLVRPDGSSFWAETSGSGIELGEGAAVLMMFRDVSVRKDTAEALRASEALLGTIADSALDSIFRKDLNLKYTFVNRAMCRLFGGVPPEALLGKTADELFGEPSAAVVREVDERNLAGEPVDHVRTIEVDGETRTFHTIQVPTRDAAGAVNGISGIVRDVTAQKQIEEEKKRLEEQFVRAQKMEAVGRLAGGIAHEFNNLLTGISGNVTLALPHLEAEHPARGALANIQEALRGGERLARQLLSFSRKQVTYPEPVFLDRKLPELREMLERIIGENIKLETRADGPISPIKADAGQLDQVVVNLVINARDAMPDGGTVTISVRDLVLREFWSTQGSQLPDGTYVEILVVDEGHGVPSEIQELIFEPFFTTKPVERGTGLGLASVHGIVTEHGGCIEVESEEGQGATFRILMPAAADMIDVAAPPGTAQQPVPGGTETILCVEDDSAVREVTVALLESFGYTVIQAEGGRQALEIFDRYRGTIELVITDVVMPDMNGLELWQRLQKLRSELKLIFTSGYPRNILDEDGRRGGTIDFLPKPYPPEKLARIVREVLDRP